MFKVKVVRISKERLVETGEPFLDVAVELLNKDGNTVDQRKFGFSVDITEKELQNELRKYADLFEAELKASAERQAQDNQDKKTDSLIEKFEGKTI